MIRTAQISDVDAIHSIQEEVYPRSLVESRSTILEIVAQGLSLVVQEPPPLPSAPPPPRGFLLVHTTQPGHVHQLHEALATWPLEHSTPLFIHDTAITPSCRGLGYASRLVKDLVSRHPHRDLELISIDGSEGFWSKQGFSVSPRVLGESETNVYGGGRVCLMARRAAASKNYERRRRR